jgi:hypothetical protein
MTLPANLPPPSNGSDLRQTELLDPIGIFRSSLRISLHTGPLWMLTLLLYCALLPAFLLAAGFGAATAYLANPAQFSPAAGVVSPIPKLPAAGWIAYILISLLVLTATTLLSWAIQAATIRASDMAADGGPVTIGSALRLGKQRWQSLAKLAFTFGLIIQAMGVLPLVLILALAGTPVVGAGAYSLVQTVLLPITTILGIFLFLLTMSIALEDLRPRMAMQRIWKVIRSGWWGFLLAYVLQGILALAFVLSFGVLSAIAVILFLSGLVMHSTVENVLGAAICVFFSPVGVALLTFIMVFSTVFYTQIYRAAARMG